MFAGFQKDQCPVNGVSISYRKGGTGPGLLLLHGHPQTHVIWHKVATDVRGKALPAGHYLAEEAPELLLGEVLAFLR